MDVQSLAGKRKQCSKCGEEKPTTEFYKRSNRPDGLRSWCKRCETDCASRTTDYAYRATLRSRYGLEDGEYDRLVEAQSGRGAICHCDPRVRYATKHIRSRRLHVDHDTGEVRGLLCFLCNRILGCWGDDAETMRSAAAYLEGAEAFVDRLRVQDHDDTIEAHYAALERRHACLGGWVFVGYIDEYGEERETSCPCRRCAASR